MCRWSFCAVLRKLPMRLARRQAVGGIRPFRTFTADRILRARKSEMSLPSHLTPRRGYGALPLAATVVVLLSAIGHSLAPAAIELVPVANGIYAAIQPDENRFNDS